MNRIKKVVSGLDNSKIHITSELYLEGVAESDPSVASNVATARLDLILMKVKSSLEHETTEVEGEIDVKTRGTSVTQGPSTGFIRFNIRRIKDSKQKPPGLKKEAAPKESSFDSKARNRDLYDDLSESFRKEVRK